MPDTDVTSKSANYREVSRLSQRGLASSRTKEKGVKTVLEEEEKEEVDDVISSRRSRTQLSRPGECSDTPGRQNGL